MDGEMQEVSRLGVWLYRCGRVRLCRAGSTRLTPSPTVTAATTPITLCQRNATFVNEAAHPTDAMPAISPMNAPFAVAHQNAGGDFDTLTRIERHEPALLAQYPGLRELSVVRTCQSAAASSRKRSAGRR